MDCVWVRLGSGLLASEAVGLWSASSALPQPITIFSSHHVFHANAIIDVVAA